MTAGQVSQDVCAKNVSQDKYHGRVCQKCIAGQVSQGRGAHDAALSARFFMRYCAFFHAVLRVFLCGKENENANNVY